MVRHDVRSRVVRPLLFVAAYVVLAKATDGLALENGFTPWYPPAGLTMAYLLLVGPKGFPVALVARWINTWVVFPDAWRDEPDGVNVRGIAIVGIYTLAAMILRRVGLRRARLRELGWFASVGVIAAPLLAAFAVAAVDLVLEGGDASRAFDSAWTFWVGDAVAVATIVPAVLLVTASLAGAVTPPRLPAEGVYRAEILLQSLALIVAPVLALAIAQQNESTGFLVLTIVPVVWVALRRDLVLAAVGLLVLNASLSIGAAAVLGASTELSELQAVMLAASLAGLYIAAVTHTQEMALADLIDSEERYRSLLSAAPDLVARFDRQGLCTSTSTPFWLAEGDRAAAVVASLQWSWPGAGQAVLADGEPRSIELEVPDEDGPLHLLARLVAEQLADGSRNGVVAVVSDLTPQRQALALLDHERRHDALTGLANRARFLHELEEMVVTGAPVALAVVDVDGFVAINEMFGSDRGDTVLRDVGNRLRHVAGPGAALGRLGADQFALASTLDEGLAGGLGTELVRAMRIRVVEGAQTVFLTGSVGMATATGSDPRALLRDADTAMHAAKEGGRDRFVLFDAERRSASLDRRGTLSLLRGCLDRQELVVHYQPIVDLETGAAHGLEALVRLPAPDGEGLLFPASFLHLAEDTGLDVELGALVLDAALGQLHALNALPEVPNLVMSVNVTARQLALPGFVPHVQAACDRHGVDPSCLRLELTETLVMADPDAAIAALQELREMGVSAALDDFGVGYSSMVYLQRLPVDVLKIDRAFVSGLPEDTDDRAIVSLMVGLARALDLSVTAEGIETEGQRLALLELGCTVGQGYLFARPGPVDPRSLARS